MRRFLTILNEHLIEAEPPLAVGAKVKGRLFVTSQNNMEFWGGYLPGAGQYGKWFPITVLITEVDEDGVKGRVKLKNVTLVVFGEDDGGKEWSIDSHSTRWSLTEGDERIEDMPYRQRLATVIADIQQFARSNGVAIEIIPWHDYGMEPNSLLMTDLNADTPGQGGGTKVMARLGELADEYQVNVITHPGDVRNRQFYERFGFEKDKHSTEFRLIRYCAYDDDDDDRDFSLNEAPICRTPGANYDITLSDKKIGATVKLPKEVTLPDLSDEAAQKYEDRLHDALEKIVAKMFAELDPEAKQHWQDARDHDKTLNEDRQKGKSLPETGYKEAYAVIYRGVLTSVTTFAPMDYVTMNRRWAIGHAEHVAAVEGEDAHVLRAMVPAKHVYEAYNPGEYFYDGPTIAGKPIRGADTNPYIAKAE